MTATERALAFWARLMTDTEEAFAFRAAAPDNIVGPWKRVSHESGLLFTSAAPGDGKWVRDRAGSASPRGDYIAEVNVCSWRKSDGAFHKATNEYVQVKVRIPSGPRCWVTTFEEAVRVVDEALVAAGFVLVPGGDGHAD